MLNGRNSLLANGHRLLSPLEDPMSLLTRRGLTPRAHGIVDYGACAAMLALPAILKLSPAARTASRAFALGYLGVSALTDYPPALRRLIPFQWHGRTELLSAPLVLLTPRLLGGAATAADRTYFAALTGMVLGAYLATDWRAEPDA